MLLTLQQVGNVRYTGWVLQVPCSEDRKIIEELNGLAREMEDELLNWKEKVKQQRENFYELNYYTMVQLLTLRKELGKLKDCKQSIRVSSEVLSLLQSVSSQITPDAVAGLVEKVVAEARARSEMEEQENAHALEMSGEEVPDLTNINPEYVAADVSKQSIAESTRTGATGKKAKPKEAEADLTEEQQEMMSNLLIRVACSEKLIRRSFKECEGKERYDYQKWCFDHLDEDEASDGEDMSSESEGESEDEDDSSHEDTEAKGRQFKYTSSK